MKMSDTPAHHNDVSAMEAETTRTNDTNKKKAAAEEQDGCQMEEIVPGESNDFHEKRHAVITLKPDTNTAMVCQELDRWGFEIVAMYQAISKSGPRYTIAICGEMDALKRNLRWDPTSKSRILDSSKLPSYYESAYISVAAKLAHF